MRIGGRKLLALLAGGAVLAGGGITTLASWQDETWDRAAIRLSSFDIEQSTGSGWVQAETVDVAAGLSLSVQGVTSGLLAPGGATTGWVSLRAAAGSLGGVVTMSGATLGPDPAGIGSQLTYQAVTGVSQARCSAGDLSGGTTIVPAGSALTTGASGAAAFHLDPGTGGAAGAEVGVCLKLQLPAGVGRAAGGAVLNPVWRFGAVSDG